jgi:hypothetical protein
VWEGDWYDAKGHACRSSTFVTLKLRSVRALDRVWLVVSLAPVDEEGGTLLLPVNVFVVTFKSLVE